MTTLPTYEQAQNDVLENVRPSALSVFITENEPADLVAQNKFRRELGDVVEEVQQNAKCEADQRLEQLRKAFDELQETRQHLISVVEAESADFGVSIRITAVLCFLIGAVTVCLVMMFSSLL